MPDLSPEFDQKDISNANGPVDTVASGAGTRLLVRDDSSSGSPSDAPGCSVLSKKLRYIVDRTTTALSGTYQTIYTYSGSGKFIGIIAEFENNLSFVKMEVDGDVIFETKLQDLQDNASNKEYSLGSLYTDFIGRVVVFNPICPILYTTNVEFKAKDSSGKKIFGYVVSLTKET